MNFYLYLMMLTLLMINYCIHINNGLKGVDNHWDSIYNLNSKEVDKGYKRKGCCLNNTFQQNSCHKISFNNNWPDVIVFENINDLHTIYILDMNDIDGTNNIIIHYNQDGKNGIGDYKFSDYSIFSMQKTGSFIQTPNGYIPTLISNIPHLKIQQCILAYDKNATPYPTSYPTLSPTLPTASPTIHPTANPTENPIFESTLHILSDYDLPNNQISISLSRNITQKISFDLNN